MRWGECGLSGVLSVNITTPDTMYRASISDWNKRSCTTTPVLTGIALDTRHENISKTNLHKLGAATTLFC